MVYDLTLEDFMSALDESGFPEGFLTDYILMECFASRHGVETFLAQDKEGNLCVAKCYDRRIWDIQKNADLLDGLEHEGLPRHLASYSSEDMTVTVREFVEGVSLDRYAQENELTEQEITGICLKICDVLEYLHKREKPVIHRDVKPQNVIVRPDGNISLIDFDIARIYTSGNETDTMFFGTPAYAPPEQYGFSQTDARTDIYSLGIVLRWLLTGSTRDNKNVQVYRPLARIIKKCTGFDPGTRFCDITQVRRALLAANPRSQLMREAGIALCTAAAVALLIFAGVRIYQKVTYSPFNGDAIPAFVNDEDRIADAVKYMRDKYDTDMFDSSDDIATVGDLRAVLIDLYGQDHDYVYAYNDEMPQESERFFLPWGWDDNQFLDRDSCVYAAVKVHDPALVADWSSIKDDNGYYPGGRVAMAFAEENGILTGANRPNDITVGEMALIFANTDRVFDAAAAEAE